MNNYQTLFFRHSYDYENYLLPLRICHHVLLILKKKVQITCFIFIMTISIEELLVLWFYSRDVQETFF